MPPTVVRSLPGSLPGAQRFQAAVVIDVLRATSTAAVLLGRGVPRVRVADHALGGSFLLVSERFKGGIDNSPVAAQKVALDGRTPLLVTTNGTRALLAAAGRAESVWAASFLNLSATVARLGQMDSVLLVASGDFASGEPHLEDELCADAVAAALAGRPIELAPLFARVRSEERVQRRLVREPMLAGDLEVCLSADTWPVAIRFDTEPDGTGWLSPA